MATGIMGGMPGNWGSEARELPKQAITDAGETGNRPQREPDQAREGSVEFRGYPPRFEAAVDLCVPVPEFRDRDTHLAAEREGFEPSEGLPLHLLSREARSARLRHLSGCPDNCSGSDLGATDRPGSGVRCARRQPPVNLWGE